MTIHRLLVLLIGLACLNSLPVSAETEEVYRFERLWPVLQQPWYFDEIWDIAVSQEGHVYVVNYNHHRVYKLTLDGQLISNFGTREGFYPTSIAVDSEENVYVRYRDAQFPRQKPPVIMKFNGNGELISDEWAKGSHCVENLDIAVDNEDHVYIACEYVQKDVQKFSSQGELLDEWSVKPLTNNDRVRVSKIAIGDNSVYLLESKNHRVQKYTTTGEFLKSWGSQGSEPGNFDYPTNIAIDSHDNIYVSDDKNHRIQKFTSEGEFLMEWRGEESKITNLSEISQCSLLSAIIPQETAENQRLSSSHFKEILDISLKQLFSTKETEDILHNIFSIDEKDIESFLLNDNNLSSIAVDSQENVYVTYSSFPAQIKKYTSKGELLTQWASYGNSQEQFNTPTQIARGKSGNLYVTDMLNHRVLKLTAEGQLIKQWGELGCSNGQFIFPSGIAVDTEENIYVVDSGNGSIQKFSAEGQFIMQWGKLDYLNMSDRDFLLATAIAVDKNNHVYVVDTLKKHIKKFTSEGTFIKIFDDSNVFKLPMGITVDNNDNVYVADLYDHNIKKFTTEGQLVEWGGSHKGLFEFPSNVATDNDGNVYVSDSANHRIQKLTSDGELITQLGEFGTNPGQFNKPMGLAVSPDGDRVYVVEPVNNRIQVFNQTRYDVGKAIIVAGGTDKNDSLWNATQMVSHFAYRALVYQGFTKNTIYYLNANTGLDLDNNGVADDVDAKPTKDKLKYAITQWAKGTDNLTIYLTDHGGDKTFQLSSTESLTAAELDEWLNTRQSDMTGSIKIIYDACQSGSFLPHFMPPEGKNRIVITSAEADRNAYFSNDGSLSFSGHFWSNVLYGANIENAFKQASTAVDYLQSTQTEQKQTPQLDSNGNNVANEPDDYVQVQDKWIGNGTFTPRGAPVIDSVSQAQTIKDTHTATITVTVNDDKGIARVWAVVRKPGDLERVVAAETITALPSFELQPVSDNQYKGSYNGFDRAGSYELAIFAIDNDNNISQPKTTTVFVETAFQRRAIIVGGHLPQPTIQNIGQAYEALRYQGYRDEEIYYLSNTSKPGVDVLTTFDNVEFALTTWAKENTQNIVIYLEGWGNDTMFRLNETETLPFSQLDSWLDTLQQNIPGAVTVIYEGPQSGHLISALTPPTDKTRIVISSTGTEEKECTNTESLELFFSQHFWQTVFKGTKNLSDAFDTAQRNVRSLINKQCPGCDFKQKQKDFPQLEANGNGIGNETEDSDIAEQQSISIGIITAGTEPIINQVLVSPDAVLTGDTTATLQVESITTPDKINRVWAVITPPCHSSDATATTVELERKGENRYQVNYEGFRDEGRYQVAIYAEDNKSRRSLPKIIYVHQQWPLKPSQAIYQEGDNIQVRLPSPLLKGDSQYLAVRLPDDNLFVIKGLNDFVPFDAAAIPAAWAGNGEVAVDNIQVTSDFPPKGKYQLYLVRIPKGTALDLTSESQILRESSCYVE